MWLKILQTSERTWLEYKPIALNGGSNATNSISMKYKAKNGMETNQLQEELSYSSWNRNNYRGRKYSQEGSKRWGQITNEIQIKGEMGTSHSRMYKQECQTKKRVSYSVSRKPQLEYSVQFLTWHLEEILKIKD